MSINGETWVKRDSDTNLIEDNGKYVCPICGRLKNKIDLGEAVIYDPDYQLNEGDERTTDLCNQCADSYKVLEVIIPCHDGRTNKSIFKEGSQ